MTFEDALSIVKPHNDKIVAEARVQQLEKALSASLGYMLNAAIDLETGAPKRTALNTINGGIKLVREALGQSGDRTDPSHSQPVA